MNQTLYEIGTELLALEETILEAGEELEFARLGTRGKSLRIK